MMHGKHKIGEVMGEFKKGTLKSSSGAMVKNPRQAMAIALSEAREAGARIPEKNEKLNALKKRLKKK